MKAKRMKVLIVVKAYPALSKKYNEIVCTAGITENGKWVRIYPIPFRLVDYDRQFKKYEWIELDLIRHKKDFRPESYRPKNRCLDDLKSLGLIKSDGKAWIERRKYVTKKVYKNLGELIDEAKDKNICTSIAVFKPTQIKDFVYKKVSAEWEESKIKDLEAKNAQISIFEPESRDEIKNFEIVNKLPYKFSFIFEDDVGKESKLMIEDWETGMLYWNSFNRHNGDEKKACEDVKKKYFYDFAQTKDYYFILGTTFEHHRKKASNPFIIIGDFRPKFQESTLF